MHTMNPLYFTIHYSLITTPSSEHINCTPVERRLFDSQAARETHGPLAEAELWGQVAKTQSAGVQLQLVLYDLVLVTSTTASAERFSIRASSCHDFSHLRDERPEASALTRGSRSVHPLHIRFRSPGGTGVYSGAALNAGAASGRLIRRTCSLRLDFRFAERVAETVNAPLSSKI